MNIKSRIGKLEQHAGLSGTDKVTVFLHEIFEPSKNGPQSCGICLASVVGGKSYWRRDFENDAAFKAEVDAEHKELHGEPVQWKSCDDYITNHTEPLKGEPVL
jgi:hypothetical protein